MPASTSATGEFSCLSLEEPMRAYEFSFSSQFPNHRVAHGIFSIAALATGWCLTRQLRVAKMKWESETTREPAA